MEEPSLATTLGMVKEDRKRVGAMVVGRFENGTPLAVSARSIAGRPTNNFSFEADPEGLKCPLFAHIRKVNPRTEESRSHRIVRRGITYDDIKRQAPPSDETQALKQMPRGGVGLLFMCLQSSIEHQFEHLQIEANRSDHDPLIGRPGDEGVAGQHWPLIWGGQATEQTPFGAFVTLKEGEYFFAPSCSFFGSLG